MEFGSNKFWLEQIGKIADLVMWKPSFFGAKPEMVIKGGVIAWANMGDPNASIPTPEPVSYSSTNIQDSSKLHSHVFFSLAGHAFSLWIYYQSKQFLHMIFA